MASSSITPSSTVVWQPSRPSNAICVFTVAVSRSLELLAGIEHNANWAVAHDSSFTLFRTNMVSAGLHNSWQRVTAARGLLSRDGCHWLMHIDADAVVVDVARGPLPLLHRMEAEAAITGVATLPAMYTTCNSPLGRGLECDVFCCGRQRRRARRDCAVSLQDEGPSSPYPW